MKNTKQNIRFTTLFTLLCFSFSLALGQESVNTSGQDIYGDGGTVSYSVGQVICETHTATEGEVSEGIQQPAEIVISAVEKVKENSWISTYPNPIKENFTLEIKKSDLSDFQFQLYDIKGRIVQSKKIKNKQTKITTSNLLSGTYILKITQKNKQIITFKIIKK